MRTPPPWLWFLLTAGALGLALFWWRRVGARRSRRLRELVRRCQAAEAAQGGPGPAWEARLRAAVEPLPAAQRRRYAQPWMLCVGDPAADLAQLLATAQPAGPLSAADGDAFWRWWSLDGMVAIEIRPPPLGPSSAPQDAAWLHALQVLARERPRLPLHGIVLCVAAATLRADPAVLAGLLELMARRLCEAAGLLGLRLPVHLVVTGLQRLEGFDAVREALPDAALARALGHRLPPEAGALPQEEMLLDALFDAVFDTVEEQLHALRLGLLPEASDAGARHGIHLFVQEFVTLRPGLRALVEQLSRFGTEGQVFWRSLYFCAVAPQAAFVHDPLMRFLPADQPLARERGG